MVRRDALFDPERGERALAGLRRRGLNFDPRGADPHAPGSGWRVDDYRQQLPPECPGAPSERGSWRTACWLLGDYEFIDPSIVRALYRADLPLRGRDMLLELRIWGLRFHVGVRIGEVSEGTVADGGRLAAVWGWNYRTLEGHFEAGQMDYEVRKWLDTGEVEFRIHAYSRTAHIANPVLRVGFRLFGRRKQTQFARHACERMRRLTEHEVARADPAEAHGRRASGDGLVVRPTVAL